MIYDCLLHSAVYILYWPPIRCSLCVQIRWSEAVRLFKHIIVDALRDIAP